MAPTIELDVEPRRQWRRIRVRVFYGLLAGETPEEAVWLGWAHGALLTTLQGVLYLPSQHMIRFMCDAARRCRSTR